MPALAAVVITSAIGLFEISDLGRLWRIQRWEFWLSLVCMGGVAVFGAIPGIGIAIVIAVLEFLWDGWRPHSAVLARPEGIQGFHDIERYPESRQTPGVLILRWDAPLFFANAELFRDRILELTQNSKNPLRAVVIAAEPVTSIDVTSADMLVELHESLKLAGVRLCFAELKDPVRDKFKRFGIYGLFAESGDFPTIEAAVGALSSR